MNYKKGFTLIELLVVISIIGLLSSIVLASLATARSKARDNVRKQQLIQVRNALETYFAQNGSYPLAGNWTGPAAPGVCGAWYTQSASWIPGLVPTYIPSLPIDPNYSASDTCNGYMYVSNGTSYKVMNYYKVETGPVAEYLPFSRMGVECTTLPGWWVSGVGQWAYAVMSGPVHACS